MHPSESQPCPSTNMASTVRPEARVPALSLLCTVRFRLRPLDIEFMKRLSKVVNIVPVIAKADTLTLEERVYFKQRVGCTAPVRPPLPRGLPRQVTGLQGGACPAQGIQDRKVTLPSFTACVQHWGSPWPGWLLGIPISSSLSSFWSNPSGGKCLRAVGPSTPGFYEVAKKAEGPVCLGGFLSCHGRGHCWLGDGVPLWASAQSPGPLLNKAILQSLLGAPAWGWEAPNPIPEAPGASIPGHVWGFSQHAQGRVVGGCICQRPESSPVCESLDLLGQMRQLSPGMSSIDCQLPRLSSRWRAFQQAGTLFSRLQEGAMLIPRGF